jgi:hypothetical protein
MRLGNRQKERLILTLCDGHEPGWAGKEGDTQRRLVELGLLEHRWHTPDPHMPKITSGSAGYWLTKNGRKRAELAVEHDLQGRHMIAQRDIIRDGSDLARVKRLLKVT